MSPAAGLLELHGAGDEPETGVEVGTGTRRSPRMMQSSSLGGVGGGVAGVAMVVNKPGLGVWGCGGRGGCGCDDDDDDGGVDKPSLDSFLTLASESDSSLISCSSFTSEDSSLTAVSSLAAFLPRFVGVLLA